MFHKGRGTVASRGQARLSTACFGRFAPGKRTSVPLTSMVVRVKQRVCRWRWREAPAMSHSPDDGGSKHLWNVCHFLWDYFPFTSWKALGGIQRGLRRHAVRQRDWDINSSKTLKLPSILKETSNLHHNSYAASGCASSDVSVRSEYETLSLLVLYIEDSLLLLYSKR
jgi:hypothetical protein